MKKTIPIVLLLLIFGISTSSIAQVSTYTFSQPAGAYTEITGTLFDSSTSTSGATSLDDVQYLSIPLGFTFTFNGNTYTTYSMNTNGQITFGTTGPGTTNYSPISSTVTYAGCVAGLARDLQGLFGFTATRTLSSTTLTGVTNFSGIVVGKLVVGTGIPAGTRVTGVNTGLGEVYISAAATAAGTSTLNCCSAELRRETTGSAGNMVHTVQWKNFKRFGTTILTDNLNFQIKLYEATGVIEVVYGYCIANATAIIPQVGLRGSTNADFNNRTTTSDWTTTSAGGTNAATCTMSNTIFPPSGLTFRWTPVPILNDVGVTANIQPTGVYFTGDPSLNPTATIRNFGTDDQTVPFYTVYKITGPVAYADSTADTLASGYQKNVTMPSSFGFGTPGTYNVTIYTTLGSDQNRNNDTLKTSFSVIDPPTNYGNDSGYFFANNLATDQISYPRWTWKDTTGSKNLILNALAQQTIVGSVDDGYFRKSIVRILAECNQDTTAFKKVKYNGVCYDSIFVATNGVIGFSEAFGTTSFSTFSIDGALAPRNAIFPFWHDANFNNLVGGTNRISYKIKQNQLIITYDRAVSFAPTTDWVSYQVVIELVKGCEENNSNWRVTFASADASNRTSASFVANYLAGFAANPPAATVFRNFVVGYTNIGAPSMYAAYVSSGNPFPASPQTQANVKRALFNLTTGAGLAIEFGPKIHQLNTHDGLVLCFKMSLQGLQSNLRVRDTVGVYIRDAQTPPYKIMQYDRVYLDSAYNGSYNYGYKCIEFSMIKRGHPIYIMIAHRNSIRSWSLLVSTAGAVVGDTVFYDFTSGTGQTFGSNAVLVNGAASFYSGDITQDGIVDGSDGSIVDDASGASLEGPYLLMDLNWDTIVDGSDALFTDNNSNSFIEEQKPPGANSVFELPPFVNYNYKLPVEEVRIIPDPYAQPKIDAGSQNDKK